MNFGVIAIFLKSSDALDFNLLNVESEKKFTVSSKTFFFFDWNDLTFVDFLNDINISWHKWTDSYLY